jgi:hypothetical protein
VTPDAVSEPILKQDYDYYTIWDYYRGEPPAVQVQAANSRAVDLDRVLEDGVVSADEYNEIMEQTLERLQTIGFAGEELDPREFTAVVHEGVGIASNTENRVSVLTAVDALTAFEYALLNADEYRETVERTATRLRAIDCELLDASGKHMLLSMDPCGNLMTDETGNVVVTLCNFELIRGLYRPLR